MEIKGVNVDSEIVVEKAGDKNSPTYYRFDLLPANALFSIAENLKKGADKHGDNNWKMARAGGIEKNINKALIHLYAYMDGDTQDDHICHAATRLLFALHLYLRYTNSECEAIPVKHPCKCKPERCTPPSIGKTFDEAIGEMEDFA